MLLILRFSYFWIWKSGLSKATCANHNEEKLASTTAREIWFQMAAKTVSHCVIIFSRFKISTVNKRQKQARWPLFQIKAALKRCQEAITNYEWAEATRLAAFSFYDWQLWFREVELVLSFEPSSYLARLFKGKILTEKQSFKVCRLLAPLLMSLGRWRNLRRTHKRRAIEDPGLSWADAPFQSNKRVPKTSWCKLLHLGQLQQVR